MAQQIHLKDGLVPGHGLDGKALAADQVVLPLLRPVGHKSGDLLIHAALKSPLAQPLLQPGLIFADLALQRGHSGVDGCVHVGGALRRAEDGTARPDGDLHSVPVPLDAECDSCGGVLFKETVQLPHLFLRVPMNHGGQVHLFVRKHKLHNIPLLSPRRANFIGDLASDESIIPQASKNSRLFCEFFSRVSLF